MAPFDPALYAERRRRFMREMGAGAALVPGASQRIRSRDTEHRYRPDSDLYYLTGFREPDAVLLLLPGHAQHEVVMFVPPKDPVREAWDGRRLGVEAAPATLGVDAAFAIDELDGVLKRLLTGHDLLYYGFGTHEAFDRLVLELLPRLSNRNVQPPQRLVDPGTILHEMRLRKDDAELNLMRRAARITAEGYRAALGAIAPGAHEYEVQAALEHQYRRLGAEGPAYTSIVAGGDNACVLHYVTNEDPLRDGELILIDSGAEFGYYACDVTRTYPINGRFNAAQRAVYDVVLEAQLEAIALVRPGEHVKHYHERAVEVLTSGMVKLGLLAGDVASLVRDEAYKQFYMHGTGHYLGLDTHDVGRYKEGDGWRMLESGMVVTVEPGLYIANGTPGVDPAFYGIGIRIEDDVLVTDRGHEVLTDAIPKGVEAIEAALRSAVGAASR